MVAALWIIGLLALLFATLGLWLYTPDQTGGLIRFGAGAAGLISWILCVAMSITWLILMVIRTRKG